jgi:hypothetical protein
MTVADEVEFTVVRLTQDEVNDVRRRDQQRRAHVLAHVQAEGNELRERPEAERHEFETELRTAQEALRSSSRRAVPGWSSREPAHGQTSSRKRSEG